MNIRTVLVSLLSVILMVGCSLQIKPLQSTIDKLAAKSKRGSHNPAMVYKFFEEDNLCDEGCEFSQYTYPEATSKLRVTDITAHTGEVSAEFDLDQKDYSGGCIYIGTMTFKVEPFYKRGALDFWIKGAEGGEQCFVVLADEEKSEGINVEVKVDLSKYAQVTKEWTHVSIPLRDFGRRGTYWDESKALEVPHRIDWNLLYGFLLATDKGQNKSFKVWVDDICILKDVYEEVPDQMDQYWDEKEEIIPVPPVASQPAVTAADLILKDNFAPGASAEVYGGKTAFKIQKTTDPQVAQGVLALYMDNTEDAGVNINFVKPVDALQLRDSKGGIAFWAKFGQGVANVFFGVVDNNNEKMVQTNVNLNDYAKVDTSWRYFMIPLKDFNSQGGWWDETKNAEIPGVVTWKKLSQVIFYTDKLANRVEEGVPAAIYTYNITFIKEVPGYVDPDELWNAFKSDAADILLFDFEKPEEANWDAIPGEESEIFCKVIDLDEETPEHGKKALEIEYSLNDWGDAAYSFVKNSSSLEKRDWSKHWALRFSVYTDKDEEPLAIQINDAGKEAYSTNFKAKKGWSEVLLPFKQFRKDPNNQESDAEINGKMDLQSVTQLVFRPITVGTMGKFRIDNVKLTNIRELK